MFFFCITEEGVENDSGFDLEELSLREYSQLTEQQRVALKGRPILGEVATMSIRLRESKEFKVCIYSECIEKHGRQV